MRELINAFWGVLHIEFTYLGITFTLYDVFIAGVILSIVGFFIGKIIFFVECRR